jgi:ParB-like chromosome segregation protein Spo0J
MRQPWPCRRPAVEETLPTRGGRRFVAGTKVTTKENHTATKLVRFNVADIRVVNRARKDLGDIPALAESIARDGLAQPPGVTPDGQLIYGQRRLAAVKRLGWETIDCLVWPVDELAQLRLERGENDGREDLRPSEKLALAQKIQERIGSRQGKRTDREAELRPPGAEVRSPEPEQGQRTDAFAAEQAGFASRAEMQRVQTVVSKGTEELQQAMDSGQTKVTHAARIAAMPKAKQKKAVRLVVKEGKSVKEAVQEVAAEDGGEEESVKDSLGNEVPRRFRDQFADIGISEAIRAAKRIQSIMRSAQSWAGRYLELNKILAACELIENLGRSAMPSCVCPDCKGAGKECATCEGLGWLPQWRHYELTKAEEANGEAAPGPKKGKK